MKLEILNNLLSEYIKDPNNPELNFKIGLYYHSIDQTASAVSFYLRTAERTSDDLLIYESLLRTAMCFHSQGCRNNSVEGMLQHAVALLPKRPEAYFHLSRFYERTEKWFLGYMISCIGLGVAERTPSKSLLTKIDYPGFWALSFEKAVCSWWCGLCKESKDTFVDLIYKEPLDKVHKEAVISNLKKLEFWKDESALPTFFKTKEEELMNSIYNLEIYIIKNRSRIKFDFEGLELIQRNYSEMWQDMFVLTMLNGKRGGTYLEIGSGYPIFENNTYLLEKDFEWKGISIDNKEHFVQKQIMNRNNFCFCMDSTDVDYQKLFESTDMSKDVDYLQIDCGEPKTSLKSLSEIISAGITAKIITFCYSDSKQPDIEVRDAARKLLASEGYDLLLSNLSYNDETEHEDWYVISNQVSSEIFKSIRNIDSTIKDVNKIFMR